MRKTVLSALSILTLGLVAMAFNATWLTPRTAHASTTTDVVFFIDAADSCPATSAVKRAISAGDITSDWTVSGNCNGIALSSVVGRRRAVLVSGPKTVAGPAMFGTEPPTGDSAATVSNLRTCFLKDVSGTVTEATTQAEADWKGCIYNATFN
jgi:hypothetical protein